MIPPFSVNMIRQLSEFEYLGNSLLTFNSNMQELNVRYDVLFSDKEKWNMMTDIFQSLSANISNITTKVQNSSGNWKTATNLLYNLQTYWEKPIEVAYSSSFNMVANFLEIENWLNQNFSPTNFSPTQILRVDFLCKNYNNQIIEGTRINSYDQTVLESLASQYNTTRKDIYKFLSYKNQITSIISIVNSYLLKNDNKDLLISDWTNWTDIDDLIPLVAYDTSNNRFYSPDILSKFNETDLGFLFSYLLQYQIIKPKFQELIDLHIDQIPALVINQFSLKNIQVSTAGAFFYKIVNGRWTFFPNDKFNCINDICSDCYDVLDINSLYTHLPPCTYSFRYILEYCSDISEPYGELQGESSLELPSLTPDSYPLEDLLSDLLS